MNTFNYIGDSINYTNEAEETINYHDVVPLTNLIGIAAAPIPKGFTETVLLTGVWELPAANTEAFAVGDVLYWNVDDKKLSKDSAGVPAGMCANAKTNAGTTAEVKLFGNAVLKAPAAGQSSTEVTSAINSAISKHDSNADAHKTKFAGYQTSSQVTTAVNNAVSAHNTNADAHATKFAKYQEKTQS